MSGPEPGTTAGDPQSPPPSGWQTTPTQSGGFQVAPIAPGPAAGVAYADLTSRIVAYIIDAIILSFVFWAIFVAVLGSLFITGSLGGFIGFGVLGIVYLAGTAVYFIYSWTRMRASPGQRVLNLETVRASDGGTLTQNEAITRWAYLFGPSAIGTVANFSLGVSYFAIGSLLSLLAFLYTIYLLYTASQDPKRQGFHDKQVGSVVVKRTA